MMKKILLLLTALHIQTSPQEVNLRFRILQEHLAVKIDRASALAVHPAAPGKIQTDIPDKIRRLPLHGEQRALQRNAGVGVLPLGHLRKPESAIGLRRKIPFFDVFCVRGGRGRVFLLRQKLQNCLWFLMR